MFYSIFNCILLQYLRFCTVLTLKLTFCNARFTYINILEEQNAALSANVLNKYLLCSYANKE